MPTKCNIPRDSFNRILLFVAGFVLFYAIMDRVGYAMWASTGELAGQAYNAAESLYMLQFWSFAYAMIFVAAIVYYFVRKDKSESLAIIVAGLTTLWGGVEDLFYYLLRGTLPDASMPWLMNTKVGTVSKILGYSTVTPLTLVLNILLFAVIGYYVINWLYKQRW